MVQCSGLECKEEARNENVKLFIICKTTEVGRHSWHQTADVKCQKDTESKGKLDIFLGFS